MISTAVLCFTLLPSLAVEQELDIDYRLNEQIISVPAGPGRLSSLQTTVFRPNGPGPFPLLVINHGKEAGDPRMQPRDRFIFMANAFVRRGYAVMVPMRQGFADSTGKYADHGCNMTANGYAQADDVRDTIAFAREQKWIDDSRIIVAGQSYGGLATIALGTQALPGVRGLINFAGGLRDDGNFCDWRSELVRAFGEYGARNKVASLWLYGINDSLFGPELVTRMHGAFTGAGGAARLVHYGAYKRDSHGLIASRDGHRIWWKETERFLEQLGMPTREKFRIAEAPTLPRTDFARIDDIAAVPYLSEHGRAAYRDYLQKSSPRAFAVSASGAWCWAEEGEEPGSRALETCEKESNQPCQLYSVDDYVVWKGTPGEATPASAASMAANSSTPGSGAVGGGGPGGNR